MAAIIARAQASSTIADTMPTTEMPSDDATDGVLTAAAGDARPRLPSAQKPVNSSTGKKSFAAAAVFGAQRRFPTRVRKESSLYATAHLNKSQTTKKSAGKGSTVTKSNKKSSKTIVGKGSTPSKSKKKGALVGPATSPLVDGVSPLVAGLAKVRAEKLKVENEKKQKAKVEQEKKQKGKSSQSKSPKVSPKSKKKTVTLPATSSNSKNDAGSVIKKRGIRRRSIRKGIIGKGRRGVISILMRI